MQKDTAIQLDNGLGKVQEIFPESYMWSNSIVIAKSKLGFLILNIYNDTKIWQLSQDEHCSMPLCSSLKLELILDVLKAIKETEK
ncbi:MAG: hypothetical protein LBT79_01745 [Elusimicrobiota bacterium]|jgi:hypothetical protein|nr:hypothetical protein [Elusimicrobiota bacterium]